MTSVEVLYTGPDQWGSTAYVGDAGIDIPITKEQVLEPGEFYDLPSGLAVAIPEGYYGRIAARSGALRNKRIRVYEGVIDAGYRGELFTYCEAVGPVATAVRPGDRLAQLIIQPVVPTHWRRVGSLPDSQRGARGFGSSDALAFSPSGDLIPPTPSVLVADKQGRHFVDPGDIAVRKGTVYVYVGGPIDFKDHARRDELIVKMADTHFGHEFYDPRVAQEGVADPSAIWMANEARLLASDLAVFLFDDLREGYGFGSPIEVYQAAMHGVPILIWHNSEQVGVYLRHLWQRYGVMIATDWRDFMRLLGEEISKARHG